MGALLHSRFPAVIKQVAAYQFSQTQETAEEPFGRKSDGNVLLGLAGGYPCRHSDMPEQSMQLNTPGNRRKGKDPIQAEDRWKACSLPSRQCTPPYGQNNNGNPPEIEMEPPDTSAVQSRFGPKWFLPVRKAQIRLARHAVCGQRRRHPDCSGVDKPPTTSLFWKGHQDDSRTLEKMCWLRRRVRWRLACATKCLSIMVTKKISPGHIWTTLYKPHLWITNLLRLQAKNTYETDCIYSSIFTSSNLAFNKLNIHYVHYVLKQVGL